MTSSTEVADDLYLRKWGNGQLRTRQFPRRFQSRWPKPRSNTATELSPTRTRRHDPDLRAPHRRRGARRRSNVGSAGPASSTYDDMLIRLKQHADRPRVRRGRVRPAARPLPRRAGRRVPGHRSRSVEIIRSGVPDGNPALLVLIGDPKQAIYGFRGADVYAYLEATGSPAPSHPADELAQRPGAARRLRRAVRRRQARPSGDRLPPHPRGRRARRWLG